ncbi:VOC family protein [Rhizobium sp. PL01]|uniref:VOC family protein n=1 Tax=Rhizobium sp. PL01 TaxID=3085631 RepID=UPI002981B817|nr:VOC family protein [Rhizobium sp. PL01]MDW5317884.1 VOC family protein [Rhizobium sp. PL01]
MRPTTASPCITTPHVAASRTFYQTHLGARLVFDCGWFISLEFGDGLSLQFMEPQGSQPACKTDGLTYNFRVPDVDDEYQGLIRSGLTPYNPPEDHPWGDRGFSVKDPNGVTLYIYSDREPALEFKYAVIGSTAT